MAQTVTDQERALACVRYAQRAAHQGSRSWEAAAENCLPLLELAARSGTPRLKAALAILHHALNAWPEVRRAQTAAALDTCVRELLNDELNRT